jgi:3-methylfumaryl-CoA hydratase
MKRDAAMNDANSPYAPWIGTSETVEDSLGYAAARGVAAMLDQDPGAFGTGSALPPLWHWFYFLARVPQSRLGLDGHPQKGGFMPPIDLPRRMFAGARLQFLKPLVLGTPARREAVIRAVSEKAGKTGRLAFVTVGYTYMQGDEVCVEEEQDIVYREPGAAVPAPVPVQLPPVPDGAWVQTVIPDTRLLFRFSALTFNAHRIHYDRPYAMAEEGYPGLVVHGPLTAILLLELARRNAGRPVKAFEFRGQAPLFDLAPFRLVGIPDGSGKVRLEAHGPDGRTAMTASAELA